VSIDSTVDPHEFAACHLCAACAAAALSLDSAQMKKPLARECVQATVATAAAAAAAAAPVATQPDLWQLATTSALKGGAAAAAAWGALKWLHLDIKPAASEVLLLDLSPSCCAKSPIATISSLHDIPHDPVPHYLDQMGLVRGGVQLYTQLAANSKGLLDRTCAFFCVLLGDAW